MNQKPKLLRTHRLPRHTTGQVCDRVIGRNLHFTQTWPRTATCREGGPCPSPARSHLQCGRDIAQLSSSRSQAPAPHHRLLGARGGPRVIFSRGKPNTEQRNPPKWTCLPRPPARMPRSAAGRPAPEAGPAAGGGCSAPASSAKSWDTVAAAAHPAAAGPGSGSGFPGEGRTPNAGGAPGSTRPTGWQAEKGGSLSHLEGAAEPITGSPRPQ